MNGSSSTVETALFTPESVGATLNALDLSLVCPLSNRLLCVRALIDAATPLATGEQDLRQPALLIRCIDAALPALFSGGSELSDAVTELLEARGVPPYYARAVLAGCAMPPPCAVWCTPLSPSSVSPPPAGSARGAGRPLGAV